MNHHRFDAAVMREALADARDEVAWHCERFGECPQEIIERAEAIASALMELEGAAHAA